MIVNSHYEERTKCPLDTTVDLGWHIQSNYKLDEPSQWPEVEQNSPYLCEKEDATHPRLLVAGRGHLAAVRPGREQSEATPWDIG
jgi:hypothetical protein